MDNELMKNALKKKKMGGLDLTIIMGQPDEQASMGGKDSELAPGKIQGLGEELGAAVSEDEKDKIDLLSESEVEEGMVPAEDGEMDDAAHEAIKAEAGASMTPEEKEKMIAMLGGNRGALTKRALGK
jgi:hypothetical protein